jgi:hypothetical protein
MEKADMTFFSDIKSGLGAARVGVGLEGLKGILGDKEGFYVDSPLVIMFKDGERVTTHIHPGATDSYETYGILICDLVRHVANAFDVKEEAVWRWVDLERAQPIAIIDGQIVDVSESAKGNK